MLPERFRPPLTLTGTYVDLVPLKLSHAAELLAAGRDPEVQRYLARGLGTTLEHARAQIGVLLDRQRTGSDLPFATRLRSTGRVVGMSRYLHIDPEYESVEIGGTFLDRHYWRTPLNTDAKLAMLRHAFEVAKAHRVSLQTDLRNRRSQAAIKRLGAVREGVFREDRLLPSGYRRSSVVYSILAGEWSVVRESLESALRRPWRGSPPPDPG